MLRLLHDQLDVVEQLELKRRAVAVAAVLAQAWPAVAQRLQERWPAFVELALQHGHRHGLDDPVDLASFASLWCLWGAAFEDKPAFAWAQEILADERRPAALKVHQLMHRTRDELVRQARPQGPTAAPVLGVAQWDAAMAGVAQSMAAQAAARTVFLDAPPRVPIVACDLAGIDLKIVEPEPLQEYRVEAGVWQRVPPPRAEPELLQWTHAPDAPVSFSVVSHPLRGGAQARLNVRLTPLATCDDRVHPALTHDSAQGRLTWKGRDAGRLSLALYAKPLPPPDPKLGPPGIAAPLEPDVQQVAIASCGLRDAGAPFGEVAVALQVYPATQWKFELRHGSLPPLQFPAPAGEPPPAAAPLCRLEADGVPRDVAPWVRGWAALQPAFRTGLEKLFNAWSRQMDGSSARLEAEASPLAGQAALTWGLRRTGADEVLMRAQGQVELLACLMDLRLAGEVTMGEARARVRLACKGRSELKRSVEQLGAGGDEQQQLAAVKATFRFPFTLEFEPVQSAGLAMLNALPVPEAMLGALSGECGLRPRPDARGWQWYFRLGVEPVTLNLATVDPLLGRASAPRNLLPAMVLVDWSAG